MMTVLCMYEEHKKPTYIEGRVGGYVILNCKHNLKLKITRIFQETTLYYFIGPLEFPQENYPIPYHLHWRKDVSKCKSIRILLKHFVIFMKRLSENGQINNSSFIDKNLPIKIILYDTYLDCR